ncbi:tail fiber protein [Rhizobium phage RHph_Y1_20]|uniref:Tail fiber protein n=1 Tax=Rhizobium phage RHph_Y1_20 TaxID=2509571 RepID=A0A7S5UUN7_9CAUD|nr:tail fiber protein [Rhizobium phage RHph_Y1_20]
MAALSRVIKTGDGSTTQFVVDFALGYLSPSDITCRVGNEADGSGNPIYRTITFLSETLLQVGGTPAGNGVQVVFERTVEKEDTIVHFSTGDVLDENNLDLSFKQILMVVHEVLDGRFGAFDSDLDMGGFRITNLGDPVDNSDAATKFYVDDRTALGAEQVALATAAAEVASDAAIAAQAAQTAAAGSASAAATSATNAATSASNAATSASSAAASALSAQTLLSGGSAGQFLGKNSNTNFDYAWINLPGGGDMFKSVYDPQGKNADAFSWNNFTDKPTTFPTTVANISDLKSMAKRDLTISSAAPSGGVDGDVWYKI